MPASAWVEDLQAAVGAYARTRQTTPTVRVTLVGGESHLVRRASAGLGDELVSLEVYPAGAAELLTVERADEHGRRETEEVTPEVIVLPVASIAKVDILYEQPDEVRFGFRAE